MNLEINRNEETETDYDETSQLYQNDQDFPLINEIEQEPKLISWFGLRVLLSCFLLQALSFGPISSFGIYQEYLSNEHPNINQHLSINLSLFSWVGTLCAALNSFFSLPSGILCDRFGHKLIAIIASFIMAISLLLASFSTQLWHLYLTQGVLCGIGISLANMPATSLPVLHFKHYGGLATGLTSAGAGIGGMSLSYLNGYLLNVTGYQNTLRINALILFFGLLISSLLIVPPKSNQAKDSYDFRTFNFKQVFDNIYENWSKYMLFSLVGLFHSFAYLIPFYFLGIFTSTELKMGWSTAAILISVLNLSSGLGKISIGLIGDKMNNININKKNIRLKYKLLNLYHLGKHPLPFNTYSFLFLVTLIASSVACFFWLLACIHPFNEPHFHNLDTIILSLLFTFVISYGILSGGSITCSSMVAKELFGVNNLTSLLGFYKASRGLGFLLGSPLGSHLINIIPYSGYRPLVLFCIFMLVLSSLIATFIWRYVSDHKPKADPLLNLDLTSYFLNNEQLMTSLTVPTFPFGTLSPNLQTNLLLPENINI